MRKDIKAARHSSFLREGIKRRHRMKDQKTRESLNITKEEDGDSEGIHN